MRFRRLGAYEGCLSTGGAGAESIGQRSGRSPCLPPPGKLQAAVRTVHRGEPRYAAISGASMPAKQKPEEVTNPQRVTVVGIGASAGGIEALREFFDAVPANLGLAYVVIVHLAPGH